MKRLLPLLLALLLSLTGCIVIKTPNVTDPMQTTEAAGTNSSTKAPTAETTAGPPAPPHVCSAEDPYVNVDKEAFYANYSPACCYQNSIFRTNHSLMSGSIAKQDQAPTVAENRPTSGGSFVRNTAARYEDEGNTYCVMDASGSIVNRIYKNGGYVTLEEVAAYVYAFGDIPANYVSKKSASPASNPWGIYLRLNHSAFSGDTSRYPYEPKLPDISGCGGSLRYYEIDIGTTGTDCDPGYFATDYNNGSRITRGAARIVYVRYDANGALTDLSRRYVFYTYNHYNDFQEYLNYEGGWGERFGNVTGGGTLSSKTNCHPTPYVAVVRRDLSARGLLAFTAANDPRRLLAA